MENGSSSSGELMRQAAALFGGGAVAGLGDGELLERFVQRQSSGESEAAEAAFGVLIARHGPMVLGVCLRTLGNPHDAEDAFQATFLVLARKAGAVRVDGSLGRWLYGVSRKVAARARRQSARRRALELSVTAIDALEPPGRPSAEAIAEQADLRALIIEELNRLPPRFREAIEACDLDGCTHEEAALRLGWPVGTVRSRLVRGRARLRDHLARRGLESPITLAPALRGLPGTVPHALAAASSRAAVRFAMRRTLDGTVPVGVATLTGGVLRAMTLTKLTVAIPAALLVAGAVAATARGLTGPPGGEPPPPEPPAAPPPAAQFGNGPQAFGGGPAPIPFGTSEFQGAGKRIELTIGPMIVLRSPSPDRLTVFNAGSGSSSTFVIPVGVTAIPIATDSVIALGLKGETIAQVAAYSSEANAWAVRELVEPASGEVNPIVSAGLAAYELGRHVYGFSAPLGRWDVLERGDGAEGPPMLYRDYALCDDRDRVYVFGLKTGRWDAIEVE